MDTDLLYSLGFFFGNTRYFNNTRLNYSNSPGSLGHLNPNGFSSLSHQGPSHKALVLVVFKRKPEKFPKESNTLIAFAN